MHITQINKFAKCYKQLDQFIFKTFVLFLETNDT